MNTGYFSLFNVFTKGPSPWVRHLVRDNFWVALGLVTWTIFGTILVENIGSNGGALHKRFPESLVLFSLSATIIGSQQTSKCAESRLALHLIPWSTNQRALYYLINASWAMIPVSIGIGSAFYLMHKPIFYPLISYLLVVVAIAASLTIIALRTGGRMVAPVAFAFQLLSIWLWHSVSKPFAGPSLFALFIIPLAYFTIFKMLKHTTRHLWLGEERITGHAL